MVINKKDGKFAVTFNFSGKRRVATKDGKFRPLTKKQAINVKKRLLKSTGKNPRIVKFRFDLI